MPLFVAVGLLWQFDVQYDSQFCHFSSETTHHLRRNLWNQVPGILPSSMPLRLRRPRRQMRAKWRPYRHSFGPVFQLLPPSFSPELGLRAPQLKCGPWAQFCHQPPPLERWFPSPAVASQALVENERTFLAGWSDVHDYGICRKTVRISTQVRRNKTT